MWQENVRAVVESCPVWEGNDVKSRNVNKHGDGVNDLWTRSEITCKQKWRPTLPEAVT